MITIIQIPTSFFNPVFNDMIFEVSSDNTGQPNFSYLFDVYCRGIFVKRFPIKPEPINGHGFFFANRILESYIKGHVVDPNSTDAFFDCADSYADYEIKYGERYGPDGTIVDYADLDNSIGYCFNGAIAVRDLFSGASLTLTALTRFALKMRTEYSIYPDQYDWMYYLCQISPAIEKMVVETYDSTDTIIDTHEFTNPSPGQAGMFMVPSGYNLNQISGTYHTAGSTPVITDDVVKMRLWFADTIGARQSRYYTININTECNGYEELELWWTNRAGGKDTYRFRKIYDEGLDPIVSNEFKQTPYNMPVGGQLTIGSPAEAIKSYFGSSQDVFTLRSDYMNDEESERMRDLHTSNYVVLWFGGNQWVVRPQVSVYDRKTTVKGQLIQYEIKVKLSQLNYSQR